MADLWRVVEARLLRGFDSLGVHRDNNHVKEIEMSTKTCPRCAGDTTVKHKATTKAPSIATMERWSNDGVAKATDGCRVEPDGKCEHGHSSWIRMMGYI